MKKRYLYTAEVVRVEGTQTFYVDADSREEADALAAERNLPGIYGTYVDVTKLGDFEYEGTTTTDDFGD